MKTKQIFAIMAVLALGIVALGGFAADDNDGADTVYKTYTISFDGNVAYADVAVLFPAVSEAGVSYETTLDAEAVENMSIMNMKSWEAIEPFVDDGKIIYTAEQYKAAADAKKVDSGVKIFGQDDTKTIASYKVEAEKESAIAFEIYEEGVVALMIEEAKDGTYTQADLDKAVEDAKKGMYTKEQLDKAVEDAKKSVAPVNDDAQTWQIISIILGALFIVMALFGFKALIQLKKAGGKLF